LRYRGCMRWLVTFVLLRPVDNRQSYLLTYLLIYLLTYLLTYLLGLVLHCSRNGGWSPAVRPACIAGSVREVTSPRREIWTAGAVGPGWIWGSWAPENMYEGSEYVLTPLMMSYSFITLHAMHSPVCGGRAVSVTTVCYHDNSKLRVSIFTKLGL